MVFCALRFGVATVPLAVVFGRRVDKKDVRGPHSALAARTMSFIRYPSEREAVLYRYIAHQLFNRTVCP